MNGTLFVVGTPIGNLGDFSPRAAEALSSCDFIAAEDTRVTIKLLNHFNIKKPMVSYHEHNRFDKADEIVARIRAGESCALVTDAGMPAISDPGTQLVRQCHDEGIPVMSVPGPSAIITAAAISGLDIARFSFEGFLSVNKSQRRAHLEEIKTEKKTMIFYEAPHKLLATLRDLHDTLGDRTCAVIKELTKIYETVKITTLAAAVEHYTENKPKGEFVIIIEPAAQEETKEQTLADAAAIAGDLLKSGMSQSEAAKQAAKQTGFKKNDIYRELL